MHRNEPLNELVTSLRALGTQKATPQRRAVVREALGHKSEGAQSVAAQVLGLWGGRESVADLREWLGQLDRHEPFIGPRGVALEALARCVGPEDVDWMLELYFGQDSVLATHEYLRLACAVDPTLARPRIVAELSHDSAIRRHAAVKLISWLRYTDTADLVRPLLADEDEFTRAAARAVLAGAEPGG
jgi:HEAT repeat protein